MTRTRIAIVHNFPAPYRMPLFQRLLQDEELDAWLFLTSAPSSIRPGWTLGDTHLSKRVTFLPEIAFAFSKRTGDKIRLNTGISSIFRWKPEVVLIYGYNEPTNFIVALECMIKKIPYILFAETVFIEKQSLRRKLFFQTFRLMIRNAAHLAPASESCASFFASAGARAETMTEVPCVPDVERLMSISRELENRNSPIRKKYNLGGKFVLLFAGRFMRVKGVEDLFTALDLAMKKNTNIMLAVVGYGPMEKYMKLQCRLRPDNCMYFGYVEEETLHELLSVADLHIMPSWYEGYGVTCAEALSFGVPSIATETSGCRHLIVDGVNGFVVKPRDPAGIAEDVLKVSLDSQLHTSMKIKANMIIRQYTMENLQSRLKAMIQAAQLSERKLKKRA